MTATASATAGCGDGFDDGFDDGLDDGFDVTGDAVIVPRDVYLTLDTGNMRHAEAIAAILERHRVKATFFVANEATQR